MNRKTFLEIIARKGEDRPEWLKEMVGRPASFRYYRAFAFLAKETNPKLIVELGTNTGAGALHFRHGSKTARIVTVDVNPCPRSKLLRDQNIEHPISDSVAYAKQEKDGSVDILYIDTNFGVKGKPEISYALLTREITAWLPKMRPGGIVLFDDIHLNEGMNQAWDELEGNKFEAKEMHPCVSFGVLLV